MVLATDIVTTVLVRRLGLGRHSPLLTSATPVELTLLLSSRATLTITATAWTKTAFAVTLLRLTSGVTRASVWFIIVTINIAMGLSALVPWIQCTPLAKGWDRTLEGECWGPYVGIQIWIPTAGENRAWFKPPGLGIRQSMHRT
jgi:uncharacterized membrane protein YwzB